MAGTLVSAPAVAEDCAQALSEYNKIVMSEEAYQRSVVPEQRADLRRLREAALILSEAEQEEACNEVLAAIKDIVEKSRESTDQATGQMEGQSREIEQLKTARSLEEVKGQLRAEEIIGSSVRNMENADLGEIDDILLATKEGDTSYAIISHGGFIGIGEKQIAVPIEHLKVTEDKSTFILNVSEEQLDGAPSFERGDFDTVTDEKWRRANDEYFSD